MKRHVGLQREMVRAREQTDELFSLISPEAVYARPVEERHRLIFYLGHLDAFDWNLLARRSKGESGFHPDFDRLFERGIDPAPGRAPKDTPADWPRREEVERYRATARDWIDRHFDELDPFLVQMAVEHRQMHAETFAYMMHNLHYDEKRGPARPVPDLRPAPQNPMVSIEAGETILGNTTDGFGWDNEHVAHRVFVPAFKITRSKISNGAYLDFVREGGTVPHFWVEAGNEWFYRGMFEEIPLPLHHPVWLTWQQADAFARWKGLSLPSEAQFHRAASKTTPNPKRDNFDSNNWDPISVDAGSEQWPAYVPTQMTGNGWEWTKDKFAPFEGFQPHPFYPGYSSDFFDDEHYVMKGASPRTAALLTRGSFRNWFRPEYPHMYAGFRLLRNA